VVVGSAIVGAIRETLDGDGRATEKTLSAVTNLVATLARGLRGKMEAAE
jgi:tryptophan synthase alpha chain